MERPGRYRFTHALMQETLLGELSTTRRIRLHGRIGEALERRWGDQAEERAARLAGHFVESATLTPEHAARAVRYSRLAAEQAETQSAWAAAGGHWEAVALIAAESLAPGDDVAGFLVRLGRAARNAGDYRAGWRALMQARGRYRELDDPLGLATATLEAIQYMAPPKRHRALIEEALERLGDREPHLQAQLLVGRAWHGDYTDTATATALDAAARARTLAEAHGYADVTIRLLEADGHRFLGTGDLGAAERAADALVRATTATRGPDAGSLTMTLRAAFAFWQGHLAQSVPRFESGIAEARRSHVAFAEQNLHLWLAYLRSCRGDRPGADAALEAIPGALFTRELFRALLSAESGDCRAALDQLPGSDAVTNHPAFDAQLHGDRARVFQLCGEDAAGRAAYDAWQATMAEDRAAANWLAIDEAIVAYGDTATIRDRYEWLQERPQWVVWSDGLFHLRGRMADALGPAEAEDHYRAGIAWAQQEGAPVEEGRCHLGLARLLARRGESSLARRHVDHAIPLFEAQGVRVYLDQAVALRLELQGLTTADPTSSIDAVAISVGTDRPNLAPQAAPDGTVTLLFSDIEGSTPLNARLGDQAFFALLQEHNAIVRAQVAAHAGFEVKSEGDGFMLAFKSAIDGLRCAIGVQRALAERNASAAEPIRVRIGLHTGEAIRDQDDFFGLHVNLAARVGSAASGGEILVSALLKELTAHAGEFSFDAGREVELKGIGPQRVHRVAWQSTAG